MSRLERKLKDQEIDPSSVEPDQLQKKLNLIFETLQENEDSINEANEQLKQLFKKTNYEQ